MSTHDHITMQVSRKVMIRLNCYHPNALSVCVQVLTLCRDTSYNILEDEMQGGVWKGDLQL